MYRLTKKAAQTRAEAMRRGRERARLDGPAPDYPAALPDLRRRIVVENFDFGHERYVSRYSQVVEAIEAFEKFERGE